MRNIVFSKPVLRSWICCVRCAHHHCNVPDSTTLKNLSEKEEHREYRTNMDLKMPIMMATESAVVWNSVERL